MADRDSHVILGAIAGTTSWHAASGAVILAAAGLGLAVIGTFLVGACWTQLVPFADALAMALLAAVISVPLQLIAWAATTRCPGWPRVLAVLGAALLAGGIPLYWAQGEYPPSRVFEQGIMRPVPPGVRVLRAWEDPTRGTWAHLATQPAGLKAVLTYLECPRPCDVQNVTAPGAPAWWTPLSMKGHTLYRHDVATGDRIFLATRLIWVNQARTEAYVAVLRPAVP